MGRQLIIVRAWFETKRQCWTPVCAKGDNALEYHPGLLVVVVDEDWDVNAVETAFEVKWK